jgi:predicted DsbA family dithiol-disulfide isomerase
MQIDIFSDPICPWCFIGKRRFERALQVRPDLEVSVRWRTFQLNPAMPEDGMERQTYLATKFGNAASAQQLYGQIGRVGALEGIDFRFDRIAVTPNTIDAHRLIRWAARAGQADAMVEALFRAYFFDGRNIGDRAELSALAAETALDAAEVRRYLDSDAEAAAVREEDMFGRRLGIDGVPCFIVDQHYALAGAQEPEAFHSLFDIVLEENRKAAANG